MPSPHRTDDYIDELEKHLDQLPRPDERTFYLLLIELANVRAQISMLTGLVLDIYVSEKGKDFEEAVARVTEGLADRQSAMREQAVEEIRSILERFREEA
jgi:hypothetical protein